MTVELLSPTIRHVRAPEPGTQLMVLPAAVVEDPAATEIEFTFAVGYVTVHSIPDG